MATRPDPMSLPGESASNLSALRRMQGPRLDQIEGISDALAKKFCDFGITHAGQLIGTAAVDDVKKHMAAQLNLPVAKLIQTINQVKEASDPLITKLYDGQAFALPGLGALSATAEIKAKIAALPPPAAAAAGDGSPSFVNLSSFFGPIRNQAFRGTCTAFAMTALHEYYMRASGDSEDLSEEYLFQLQKALDRVDPPGNPRDPNTVQSGSWLISAASVLSRFGQCLEATYPYNPGTSEKDTNNFRPRTPAADAEAPKYKLTPRMLQPTDVAGIRAALAGGSPVAVSFTVYKSWFQAADTIRTGRITMPFDGEQPIGGHAVCLVGYQDDDTNAGGGYFILRNQWQRVGLEFGGNATSVLWAQESQYGTGYGTIPYAYLAKDGSEAFALTSVPSQPDDDNQGGGDQGGGDQGGGGRGSLLDLVNLPAEGMEAGAKGKGVVARGYGRLGGEKPGRLVIETKDGTRIYIG